MTNEELAARIEWLEALVDALINEQGGPYQRARLFSLRTRLNNDMKEKS